MLRKSERGTEKRQEDRRGYVHTFTRVFLVALQLPCVVSWGVTHRRWPPGGVSWCWYSKLLAVSNPLLKWQIINKWLKQREIETHLLNKIAADKKDIFFWLSDFLINVEAHSTSQCSEHRTVKKRKTKRHSVWIRVSVQFLFLNLWPDLTQGGFSKT